jgi:hypothetical protein
MVVCDCVKCGGSDENITCENQLIEMRSGIYRSQRFNTGLFIVAIVLCFLGLLGKPIFGLFGNFL